MSAKKPAWHPPFTDFLQQRRPRWVTVTPEVQLTAEPLRVDDVLEVRVDVQRDPADVGDTLRGMWPRLRRVGLLEYKSVAWPFHHGDLYRLIAYGMLWLTAHQTRSRERDGARARPEEVTLILALPTLNRALRDELDALSLALPVSESGYHTVTGLPCPLLVIDLGAVAEREHDELLRWFVGLSPRTLDALRWVGQHLGRSDAMGMNATPDLEGYEEYVRRVLEALTPEQRLAGLAPEQRLAGLAPEQRLAGLAPEQIARALERDLDESAQVLALPDRVLRGLSEEYIASLPDDVRAKVRARRG